MSASVVLAQFVEPRHWAGPFTTLVLITVIDTVINQEDGGDDAIDDGDDDALGVQSGLERLGEEQQRHVGVLRVSVDGVSEKEVCDG